MARIKHGTLTANTAASVQLDPYGEAIEVVNVDGADAIYFTVDGTTAVIGADDTEVVPATIAALRVGTAGDQPYTVSMISAGTPKYSVRVL
jgi:hypothetical protein